MSQRLPLHLSNQNWFTFFFLMVIVIVGFMAMPAIPMSALTVEKVESSSTIGSGRTPRFRHLPKNLPLEHQESVTTSTFDIQAVSLAAFSSHSPDSSSSINSYESESFPKEYSQTISDDGRYLAFTSFASNLVPGQTDTNDKRDVFVFDQVLGVTELVSRAAGSTTTTANHKSFLPMISGDGRFIVYVSLATDLVAQQTDTELYPDIFVFDRVAGTTELVSREAGSVSTVCNHWSNFPVISRDGQFITFVSYATNLVDRQKDLNLNLDVFVFDRLAGTNRIVSGKSGSGRIASNRPSFEAVISANGRFITFMSYSTNLVEGQRDTNHAQDVFVFDQMTGKIQLVSRAADGALVAGNNHSGYPTISADGQFIAYESLATNLVPGQQDTNRNADVFVFDRLAGTTQLVSHSAGKINMTGNNYAQTAVISADGRVIAFSSIATNLLTDPPMQSFLERSVFAFDRLTQTNQLVTRVFGKPTVSGDGRSFEQAISADGRMIVFSSEASNLVEGQIDRFEGFDIFAFDRMTGAIELISRIPESMTTSGNSYSSSPILSADGRYIAFDSQATNLVSEDRYFDEDNADVMVFDRTTGRNTWVSRVTQDKITATGNFSSSVSPERRSMSADGRYLVFTSFAVNLVPGQVDENRTSDVFVFDQVTGTVELVSRKAGNSAGNISGNESSSQPEISADGRFIVFSSRATNLVAGQIDLYSSTPDVFLFDRVTGTTELVSRAAGTVAKVSNGLESNQPVISADGRYIAFSSNATNLVSGQPNQGFYQVNVYVFDRMTGITQMVSRARGTTATPGNNNSQFPTISADGQFIAFVSGASNLVTGQIDSRFEEDVFVFDRVKGMTQIVSRAAGTPTTAGNRPSFNPGISANGNVVVFISKATNLVVGQTEQNSGDDVFAFDQTTGITQLVSRAATNEMTTGNQISSTDTDRTTDSRIYLPPKLSENGQFIAFSSLATDLVAGGMDLNSSQDIFVFDRMTGTVQLVSREAESPRTTGNGKSASAMMNADGRFITFVSNAVNLVKDYTDSNTDSDVFVFDRVTGITQLVSQTKKDILTSANARSYSPLISNNGQIIVFASTATDFISNDFNRYADVFIARVRRVDGDRTSVTALAARRSLISKHLGWEAAFGWRFLSLPA